MVMKAVLWVWLAEQEGLGRAASGDSIAVEGCKGGPAAEMVYLTETGILTVYRFKFSFKIGCHVGSLSLEGPFLSCLS